MVGGREMAVEVEWARGSELEVVLVKDCYDRGVFGCED